MDTEFHKMTTAELHAQLSQLDNLAKNSISYPRQLLAKQQCAAIKQILKNREEA